MTYITATAAAAGEIGSGVVGIKTADYAIQSGDNKKAVLVDSSASSFTITLPAPASGFIVTVSDYTGACGGTYHVIVQANSTEKISGLASGYYVLGVAYAAMSFISDGTDWYLLNGVNVTEGIATYGYILGGYDTSYYARIESTNLATLGNLTLFGSIAAARSNFSAVSSYTRGVSGGGYNSAGASQSSLDYIQIGGSGVSTSTTFGTLTATWNQTEAAGNATRGLFGSGRRTSAGTNIIEYVTIATTGNSIDFGDLTVRRARSAAMATTTIAFWCGGYDTVGLSELNVIDKVYIATTGNATDVGDLTVARYYVDACSNRTLGIIAGGVVGGEYNTIDHIVSTAATGDATDYGDLTVARDSMSTAVSHVRAIFAGGYSTSYDNTIDYIAMSASHSNATDFGDMLIANQAAAGISNGHGGLL